ncbi:50S ribosomal protein L17 [Candidatus Gottesmanbacteria bacterium]|nr:50S ribosomal protein L17 [Candidatus Gottesmanbacteria bacterium]
MNKRKQLKKLNRTTDERKRLFRNLIASMAKTGAVVTTKAKAQAVKPLLEKLVTEGKGGTLTHIRRVITGTGDVVTARTLLGYSKLFAKRPGGYTRMIRLPNQAGDNASMVKLEWVEKLVLATQTIQGEQNPHPSTKVEAPEELKEEKKPTFKSVRRSRSTVRNTK